MILANTPAPAAITTPVGASSETINVTAGLTHSGCIFSITSGGIKSSVILVPATGVSPLHLILYFAPSSFNVFIKPKTPILAAP